MANKKLLQIESFIDDPDGDDALLDRVSAESYAVVRLIHACMKQQSNTPFFQAREQISRIVKNGFLSRMNEALYMSMEIVASQNALITPDTIAVVLLDKKSYSFSDKIDRGRKNAYEHLCALVDQHFDADHFSYLNMWETIVLREDLQDELNSILRRVSSRDKLRDISMSLSAISQRVSSLLEGNNKHFVKIDDAYHQYWDSFNPDAIETYKRRISLGLGFDRWILGGVGVGDVAVCAAPPGHGKTTALLNTVVHAALKGHKVILFSAEMDRFQVLDVVTAIVADIDKADLIVRDADVDTLRGICVEIAGVELYIDDTPLMTIEHIERVMYAHPDADLVVGDHIHAMSAERRLNGEGELISYIIRKWKEIARSTRCAVLVAAQLNREGEEDEELHMHHLKYSSQIEQLASIVLMMRRHTEEEDEWSIDGDDGTGYGFAWLRKIREAGHHKDKEFVYSVNTRNNRFRMYEEA